MAKKTTQRRLGREKLQTIVEMCKSVEERSLDPFQIDVDEILNIVRKYFPEWKLPEELCLDAETLHRLASIIKLQSEWVKHRSTTLYTDPFLLEDKLARIDRVDLVEIFLRTWHPIVELEQITHHSLSEAMKYWENLLPMKERWGDFPTEEVEAGLTTREELIREGILGDKEFSEELEDFWELMKKEVRERGEDGKIRYWDFIGSETYEETIHKAFMTSFLITYDYATLEIHPLEEEIFIKPYQRKMTKIREEQLISIPIPVTREKWIRWQRGEPDE